MKKIISLLLVIVLCFTACPISAFAEGDDVKIVVEAVPSKNVVSLGETFTVDFNLTTNAGFYTLGLEVIYDAEYLEIVCPNHADGSSCIGTRSPITNKYKYGSENNNATDSKYHTSTPYKIMWAFGTSESDCMYTGKLATLTFKLKKVPATDKDIAVTLVVDQSSSIANGKYLDAERKAVSTSVKASHSFGDWVVTKAPTCTEKGTETKTCSVCGETENRDVAATGHSFGDWAVTKAPTCTENGTETKACSTCGETENRDVAALGHNFGEWVVVKEPTETENGKKVATCSVCQETKEEIIPCSVLLGDVDGSEEVTDADAEYLLMYTFFPEDYPINQDADFTGDGSITDADAEYLLMFTFFPEDYPLN